VILQKTVGFCGCPSTQPLTRARLLSILHYLNNISDWKQESFQISQNFSVIEEKSCLSSWEVSG
jgi:hypothetical protein